MERPRRLIRLLSSPGPWAPTPGLTCRLTASAPQKEAAAGSDKQTLLLTWAGLPPAGSHQLCLAHSSFIRPSATARLLTAFGAHALQRVENAVSSGVGTEIA